MNEVPDWVKFICGFIIGFGGVFAICAIAYTYLNGWRRYYGRYDL